MDPFTASLNIQIHTVMDRGKLQRWGLLPSPGSWKSAFLHSLRLSTHLCS